MLVRKIVSGGQTGVDRTALDVAIFLQIPHGGWCPLGRIAEDGKIPKHYQLTETDAADYSVRTEKNVVDSDGTLILYQDRLTGGTKLTAKFARQHERPMKTVDLSNQNTQHKCDEVRQWLVDNAICTLNVAGPRASGSPEICSKAEEFLLSIFCAKQSGKNSTLLHPRQ